LKVVAGINLKSLEPKVWDPESPYYLPDLKAVMVSYADFCQWPAQRRRSMEIGIHASLGIPKRIKVYLDNGAFYFSARGVQIPIRDYEEFAVEACPDWKPIPRDFIPSPGMSLEEQRECLNRTMRVNRTYRHDGYVPVAHISRVLPDYITRIKAHEQLSAKKAIALGAIVPNLLRAPNALTHREILDSLRQFRRDFTGKKIHVFGIGGIATLHLVSLLKMDSVDSSGWRNRAARGLIQLPGHSERMIAELGSWRGRRLSDWELRKLRQCECPACVRQGKRGLRATGVEGFRNRATHNLWTLLKEEQWVDAQLRAGTYRSNYKRHLTNTIYRPLIDHMVEGSAASGNE
jgi:7-cyano-7-deazaguanine tRNA-ribosyltransferase